MQSEPRRLRVGVVGLGRAFSIMAPTFALDRRVEVVAGCDTRPEARERFSADFNAAAYASVPELCGDARVEIIYIATPHQHHASNAIAAAQAERENVVVERQDNTGYLWGYYVYGNQRYPWRSPYPYGTTTTWRASGGMVTVQPGVQVPAYPQRPRWRRR